VSSSENQIEHGPLVARFVAGFRRDPSRVAISDETGQFSWRSVLRAASGTARLLSERHGRVGVVGVSDRELMCVMLGAAMVGRPVCTLHGDWSDDELQAALQEAGVEEVFTRRATLPASVVVNLPPVLGQQSADEPEPEIDASCDAEDPLFYVGFTSGSSGRPKPFARRQRSWSLSFDVAAEMLAISSETEVVLAGSLQHSHFLFGAMLGWSQGAGVRFYERFDPHALARDLHAANAAVVYLVPTMIAALDRAGAAPMDGVRSIVVSGAKMEPHHWEAAARLFPSAETAELYGASETSFMTVNRRGPVADDPGYVGLPFPGVEIEIRPHAEADSGHGVVYVRSPYLFEGYLDAGEILSGVPDDGLITAGDIGTIRPDGGLSLSGRASNLLITGGKNVHPEEVEIALADHPAVTECVIVGVPHPYWGEELVACVVTADRAADTDELEALLRSRVASYKVPKRWIAVDRLPRTTSGKIDRRRARQLAAP